MAVNYQAIGSGGGIKQITAGTTDFGNSDKPLTPDDLAKAKNLYVILTNQPGPKTWPITAATYMLMRTDYPAAKNHAVLKFLDWAMRKGGEDAKKLDYVPIPHSVISTIEISWTKDLGAGAWGTAK